MEIIYEDEVVIAVAKPAGLLSQQTRDPNRDHVVAKLRRKLENRGEDEPYLALHHRLDLGTSGVLVLAKDRAANKGLSTAFQEGEVTKIYRALATVDGSQRPPIDDDFSVANHLASDPEGPPGRQTSVRAGGDWAKTDFEVVRRAGLLWELKAMPVSGRRHQIRVHLAERGLPIAGDELYGGCANEIGTQAPRMMLHAHRLMMPHPVKDTYLELEAPVPSSFERLMASVKRGQ